MNKLQLNKVFIHKYFYAANYELIRALIENKNIGIGLENDKKKI